MRLTRFPQIYFYRRRQLQRDEELKAVRILHNLFLMMTTTTNHDDYDNRPPHMLLGSSALQARAIIEEEDAKQTRLIALKRAAMALELLVVAYLARKAWNFVRAHPLVAPVKV